MNITRPTLLIDKSKCLENIRFLSDKAQKLGVKLRPHFKTHQSVEVGRWFRKIGTSTCTVSSIKMARYFLDNGWRDITCAFPLNIREIDEINKIASEATFNTIIISPKTLSDLKGKLFASIGAYIKINTGSNRTGLEPDNFDLIEELLQGMKENSNITFKGFLAHSGHTYTARSKEEVETIHAEEMNIMMSLKKRYKEKYPQMEISVGDTPACSISENYNGVDEIRPGNYVYYDIMQYLIGSCNHHQIAIALACPVVAKHEERNEIIVHGGAVHLSKDYVVANNGKYIYGYLVHIKEGGWTAPIEGAYVRGLSQEHGIIKAEPRIFNSIQEGDVIGILPIHSCLTADLMKEVYTLQGEKIEMMR
jgi:D-serine deaminase-like pyridoxal phosphate-dependent protein